jgi:hypothetical protein
MEGELDAIVLPDGVLDLGAEIARGANGAVYDAMLYGARVCAKVRRQGRYLPRT